MKPHWYLNEHLPFRNECEYASEVFPYPFLLLWIKPRLLWSAIVLGYHTFMIMADIRATNWKWFIFIETAFPQQDLHFVLICNAYFVYFILPFFVYIFIFVNYAKILRAACYLLNNAVMSSEIWWGIFLKLFSGAYFMLIWNNKRL